MRGHSVVWEKYLENLKPGKAAVLLAMSPREQEGELLDMFNQMGFKCGVTETGGMRHEIEKKVNNALLGMGFNLNILRRDSSDVHAAVHAAIEACNGLLLHSPMVSSYSLKIALVRKDKWLAVALYGYSAAHNLTNHERIGLGIMHVENL